MSEFSFLRRKHSCFDERAMEDFDDRTKKILDAANSRRFELEKENAQTSFMKSSPKTPFETSPRKVFSESQPDSSPGVYRSKFAALAAADEEFVYEPPCLTGKEDRKGPLLVGVEESPFPIELFRPKCHYLPLKNSSKVNVQGSSEKKVTIKDGPFNNTSLRIATNEETISETTSTEFGLHTFLTKKVVQHESATSLNRKENETSGIHSSPISFNPKSTSSPINENLFVRSTSASKKGRGPSSEISPIRHLEISQHNAGLAKNEREITQHGPHLQTGAISSIPAYQNNPASEKPISKSAVMAEVKPRLATFQTFWHSAVGTPIVQGADPNESTKPIVAPTANIKNLRSRWEFSSTTGAPLHPDATEDDLLKTARHMAETAIPAIPIKKTVKKLPFLNTTTYQSTRKSIDEIRDTTNKMPCNNDSEEDEEENQEPTLEQEHIGPKRDGEVIEGDFDDFDFQHDTNENMDGIKAIDAAFEFINSPQKRSRVSLVQDDQEIPTQATSLAPLAAHETSANESPEKTIFTQPYTPTFASANSPQPSQPLNCNTTHSSDSDPTLAYSVSFYRKQRSAKDDKIDKIVFAGVQTPAAQQKVIQAESHHDREKRVDAAAHIQQAIGIEEERVAQASRALMYCRQSGKFSGSREEDFLKGLISHFRDIDILYYFIILIKCETTLLHTALISNEDGINDNGSIEFKNHLQIENIQPDFNCTFEVYALRSKKEDISHEEKYRIKGGTLKTIQSGFTTKTQKTPSHNNPILDSGFQLVGRLNLHMKGTDRHKFHLIEPQHPLSGELQMKIQKFATGKAGVSHRGFLSLYQKTQGLASWTRYWCALEKGEMKFWRSPEDENTKSWAVSIVLSTCTKDGAIVEPHGNFPHSFHIDVWVPKEGTNREMEKLRVLMAADHKEMLVEWINVLNKTIRHLLVWNTSI
ncbi:unnamed protein product, partial [Mesorhabditis belari]|uniref:PH domain-containing protein n=1 Tax=Mesorhabditis belari TaxID=2138241 RepID=A0AAF3J1V5_9BILA